MSRKNIPEARQRILAAAVRVFAAESFEGARIDEVAAEAGVPKSLIYYHFKSKDAILETLFTEFLQEYRELLKIAEHDTHESKAAALPGRIRHHYRDFAVRNADLIRVMLMDSLKKSTVRPPIYKIVEAMIDAEQASAMGADPAYDREERLVTEFFTGVLPMCALLCFADSWSSSFGMQQQRLEELFVRAMTATHGAYHGGREMDMGETNET